MTPMVSIVLPVYNRDHELRRSLASVQGQTYRDFECLIVDDASSLDIAGIVADFNDPRFRCIRRDTNGGPTAARQCAFAQVAGEYLLGFDSDWELYPWALEQGVRRFANHPTVDVICALNVRHEDSRLFVRVEGGERVITPSEFRKYEPAPDRVAMVRRSIVDLWLSIPGDYFALEASFWITTELTYASLALDEPWARIHTQSADSVTAGTKTQQGRARQLADYATFLDERQDLIDCGPCISVDRMLEGMYFELVRAKHPCATNAAAALRSRGVVPRSAIVRQLSMRVRRKLGRIPNVQWV
jgi:glycosyltransferase involved in cell wall biosynthesis